MPTDALREAVLNAVIHRDYSMHGSDIKVAVFDSRIEIVSPGSFPKGITVEDVISGRSEVRNRIIARIFHESGAIEQWGRGVQLILRLCDEAGLPVPTIEESGMFVRLTLYRPVDEKVDEGTKVDEKVDEGTNRSSCPFGLADWFANHDSINIREAMDLFGLSKSGANKRLNGLVSDNILEMHGKGKGARYALKRLGT